MMTPYFTLQHKLFLSIIIFLTFSSILPANTTPHIHYFKNIKYPTFKAQRPFLFYLLEKLPLIFYINQLGRRWHIPPTEAQYFQKIEAAQEYFKKTGDDAPLKQYKEEYFKSNISREYPFTRDIILEALDILFYKTVLTKLPLNKFFNIINLKPSALIDALEYGPEYFIQHHIGLSYNWAFLFYGRLNPINYVYNVKSRWNIPGTKEEYRLKLQHAIEHYQATGDPLTIEQVRLQKYKEKRLTLRFPFTRDVILYGTIFIAMLTGGVVLEISRRIMLSEINNSDALPRNQAQ